MRTIVQVKRVVVSTIAVMAVLGFALGQSGAPLGSFVGAAWAGQETGQGHQGGQGAGGKGSQAGQGTSGEHGSGQGGPGEDSDAKGPHAGSPSSSGGGKPVWSQEGIPEIELGRLNVARSPDKVLDQAYAEALKALTADMVSYYNLPLDEAIEQLSLNWDNISFIDSPLENLALLKDALDGSSALTDHGVTNDLATLEAMLLGAASDKTVPITADTVVAVTTILGTPITGDAAVALAADADAVRIAILAGHDS